MKKIQKYRHDDNLPAFVATYNFFGRGEREFLLQVLTLNLNSKTMRCRFFDPDTQELIYGSYDISIEPFTTQFEITAKK